MSAAALENTLTTVPDKLNNGIKTYNFGRAPTITANVPRSTPTQDGEVRKTIQIDLEKTALRTTTRHLEVEEYFKPIKNWEGVVESISDKSFVAAMRDANNPADRGEEQFEIDIADVELGDRDLVQRGAIFYFTIGYRIRRGGTRIKGTQIVFRRMPRWSKKDIQRAHERANKYLEIMMGENRLERSA